MLGFRFDANRDAYVLRLVGGRVGPVLRTQPSDSAARAMEWPEALRQEEALHARKRRKTGRFAREQHRPAEHRREHSLRD